MTRRHVAALAGVWGLIVFVSFVVPIGWHNMIFVNVWFWSMVNQGLYSRT